MPWKTGPARTRASLSSTTPPEDAGSAAVEPLSDPTAGFATRAIRTGHRRTPEGEHGEPIFATSSFVFANAAEAAARFSGDVPGNIYSRFTNPTVRAFEERLASLEGGESCVATASGMAAILALCMGLLQTGDHIVSSRSIFGTTTMLFNKYLARFGIETSYVPLSDPAAWEAAIRPRTRLLFCETPSNPLTEMADIRALAAIARARDCVLAVDNCFCTPALQRPLELGRTSSSTRPPSTSTARAAAWAAPWSATASAWARTCSGYCAPPARP